MEVLVIGGGVAGIQASLDLAEMGFRVYLVEKEPSIGGRMAQLDKTFPTMDCSICILAPKMIDCARHPNIKLLTYSEVKEIRGSAGNFVVKIVRKPRYVDEEKCTGCGVCLQVGCPAISKDRKTGKAVIDELLCVGSHCTVCAQVCPFDAISSGEER